jgi:hypothetical protein
MLGRLQHLDQVLLGLLRFAHVLSQAIDVELDAGDALQRRNHAVLDLLHHIVAHVRRDPAVALVGHVQHDHLAAVLLPDQLEPLHEREAAGVGKQQHVGFGQRFPGGANVAGEHHAEVGLDVGADVLRVAVALGVQDHLAGTLAQRVLQRVGFGQAAGEIEAHQQLVQVARHEGGGDFSPAVMRDRQVVVVAVDHLLLQQHRVLFLDRRRRFFRRGHCERGTHGWLPLRFWCDEWLRVATLPHSPVASPLGGARRGAEEGPSGI